MRGESLLDRDTNTFKLFEYNYWEYYKELEDEFLHTKKYVEFREENDTTFSVEFLKLYQAVCSEIDTVGKMMAGFADPSFSPSAKDNNIKKWWNIVQDQYFLSEGPYTPINPSSKPKQYLMGEYICFFMNRIQIKPWGDFNVFQEKNSKGNLVYKLRPGSNMPHWWSDYNKVKHGRSILLGDTKVELNYKKANLHNLRYSFAALYVLEKAFMDTVGSADDLQAFNDHSSIFVKSRNYTFSEMDELLT